MVQGSEKRVESTPLHETILHPFAAMIHASPLPALLVARDGSVIVGNARAHDLLERDPRGARLAELFHERARSALSERLARLDAASPGEDLELDLALASEGLVSLTFLPLPEPAPGAFAVLLRDLTRVRVQRDVAVEAERKEYERAHADDRKMVDLGKLVSGVTHEMRTPLAYVQNHTALAEQELARLAVQAPSESVEVLRRCVASSKDGLARIEHLIEELRPLSKNRPRRDVAMSLADLVVDAVRTFEATKVGATRIELDLESTHAVMIDREDMLNVLANLLNNAAQAMDNAGVIHVRTRNRDAPPEIRIRDLGPGVPLSQRDALFRPFFTTKPDGTGLGLFISRRTVEAHGGTLTYEDAPEGGACFVIRLPSS